MKSKVRKDKRGREHTKMAVRAEQRKCRGPRTDGTDGTIIITHRKEEKKKKGAFDLIRK